MLPASNNGPGMNEGFPDVCLTPIGGVPVPISYPNFAVHAMAANFSVKVRVAGANALNLGTIIPMTFGMEPGVLHPLYKQLGAFVQGNPKVIIQALPAINLLCPTTGNAGNNAVGAVLVPGAPNIFYTFLSPVNDAPASEEKVTFTMGEGGVGVLRIREFSLDVPSRVFQAIRELSAQGMRVLTIDLRDNPGGELRAFLELAGDFLPQGSEIATVEDGDGDAIVYTSRQDEPYTMPVVIFVNRGTASAAEFFAGVLRAHGRALVVGGETYGKTTGWAICVDERGVRRETAVRVRVYETRPND